MARRSDLTSSVVVAAATRMNGLPDEPSDEADH